MLAGGSRAWKGGKQGAGQVSRVNWQMGLCHVKGRVRHARRFVPVVSDDDGGGGRLLVFAAN